MRAAYSGSFRDLLQYCKSDGYIPPGFVGLPLLGKYVKKTCIR